MKLESENYMYKGKNRGWKLKNIGNLLTNSTHFIGTKFVMFNVPTKCPSHRNSMFNVILIKSVASTN